MKRLFFLIIIISSFSFTLTKANEQPTDCPRVNELEETSIKDKTDFLKALKKIVSKTYQNGEFAKFYTDWRVITATPFPLTVSREKDEAYYGMAKHFCGKEVADRSWLARLYFPKWEGKSASNLKGQILLGADLTTRQSYPTYMLGKKIKIGTFLQRIEAIVAIIWILSVYFKVTISYYGLSLGLAQLLGLKNYQILLYPLAFLLVPLSIFSFPNTVHFQNFTAKTWTPYALTIGFSLPLLLLVVGKIRKKRSATKATKLPVN